MITQKTLTKVAWVSMHDKNKIILSGLSGLKPVLLMYLPIELDIVDVAVITADVSNEESLEEMCGRCRILLDVVGPYVLYGEAVVKACINQVTDYVDITGETFVSGIA